MTKITLISDLHGNLPQITKCDLCIIAGDVTPIWDIKPKWNHNEDFQKKWLEKEFKKWLLTINAKKIIGIAGNHDKIFQTQPDEVPKLPWTYLQDSGTEYENLKIWGNPWTSLNSDWVFTLPGNELAHKYNLIPDDTDIVITHNPPYGIGDKVPGFHIGSSSLLERIKHIKPKLHVFGHIHPGHGVYKLGNSTLVNASLLDDDYRMINRPIVLEI